MIDKEEAKFLRRVFSITNVYGIYKDFAKLDKSKKIIASRLSCYGFVKGKGRKLRTKNPKGDTYTLQNRMPFFKEDFNWITELELMPAGALVAGDYNDEGIERVLQVSQEALAYTRTGVYWTIFGIVSALIISVISIIISLIALYK